MVCRTKGLLYCRTRNTNCLRGPRTSASQDSASNDLMTDRYVLTAFPAMSNTSDEGVRGG